MTPTRTLGILVFTSLLVGFCGQEAVGQPAIRVQITEAQWVNGDTDIKVDGNDSIPNGIVDVFLWVTSGRIKIPQQLHPQATGETWTCTFEDPDQASYLIRASQAGSEHYYFLAAPDRELVMEYKGVRIEEATQRDSDLFTTLTVSGPADSYITTTLVKYNGRARPGQGGPVLGKTTDVRRLVSGRWTETARHDSERTAHYILVVKFKVSDTETGILVAPVLRR